MYMYINLIERPDTLITLKNVLFPLANNGIVQIYAFCLYMHNGKTVGPKDLQNYRGS